MKDKMDRLEGQNTHLILATVFVWKTKNWFVTSING